MESNPPNVAEWTLRQFIDIFEEQPGILDQPELSFFKTFLLKLGADIQEATKHVPPCVIAAAKKEDEKTTFIKDQCPKPVARAVELDDARILEALLEACSNPWAPNANWKDYGDENSWGKSMGQMDVLWSTFKETLICRRQDLFEQQLRGTYYCDKTICDKSLPQVVKELNLPCLTCVPEKYLAGTLQQFKNKINRDEEQEFPGTIVVSLDSSDRESTTETECTPPRSRANKEFSLREKGGIPVLANGGKSPTVSNIGRVPGVPKSGEHSDTFKTGKIPVPPQGGKNPNTSNVCETPVPLKGGKNPSTSNPNPNLNPNPNPNPNPSTSKTRKILVPSEGGKSSNPLKAGKISIPQEDEKSLDKSKTEEIPIPPEDGKSLDTSKTGNAPIPEKGRVNPVTTKTGNIPVPPTCGRGLTTSQTGRIATALKTRKRVSGKCKRMCPTLDFRERREIPAPLKGEKKTVALKKKGMSVPPKGKEGPIFLKFGQIPVPPQCDPRKPRQITVAPKDGTSVPQCKPRRVLVAPKDGISVLQCKPRQITVAPKDGTSVLQCKPRRVLVAPKDGTSVLQCKPRRVLVAPTDGTSVPQCKPRRILVAPTDGTSVPQCKPRRVLVAPTDGTSVPQCKPRATLVPARVTSIGALRKDEVSSPPRAETIALARHTGSDGGGDAVLTNIKNTRPTRGTRRVDDGEEINLRKRRYRPLDDRQDYIHRKRGCLSPRGPAKCPW